MKDKKNLIKLAILVAVIILIIGLTCWLVVVKQANENATGNNTTNVTEKYVKKLSDGTKLNTSEKLKETKKVEELDIVVTQLKSINNSSTILGTIENKTDKKLGRIFSKNHPIK